MFRDYFRKLWRACATSRSLGKKTLARNYAIFSQFVLFRNVFASNAGYSRWPSPMIHQSGIHPPFLDKEILEKAVQSHALCSSKQSAVGIYSVKPARPSTMHISLTTSSQEDWFPLGLGFLSAYERLEDLRARLRGLRGLKQNDHHVAWCFNGALSLSWGNFAWCRPCKPCSCILGTHPGASTTTTTTMPDISGGPSRAWNFHRPQGICLKWQKAMVEITWGNRPLQMR